MRLATAPSLIALVFVACGVPVEDEPCAAGACVDASYEEPVDAGEAGSDDAGFDAGSPVIPFVPGPGAGLLCGACATDDDCGGGGALCIADDSLRANVCGTPCRSARDCAPYTACFRIVDEGGVELGANCLPRAGTCRDWNGAGANALPGNPAGGVPGLPDAGPEELDAGSSTAPDAGSGPACTDTWRNFAGAFFDRQCERCHTWAQTYLRVKARAVAARARIFDGTMPRGVVLDQAEKQRILEWLGVCRMPE